MNQSPVILVVEDKEDQRWDLINILKLMGLDTIEAGSYEEAVQAIDGATRIDLAILDVDLGKGHTGIDIGELLLQEQKFSDKPPALMVYSGQAKPEHFHQAISLNVAAYVDKSVDQQELELQIQVLLLRRDLLYVARQHIFDPDHQPERAFGDLCLKIRDTFDASDLPTPDIQFGIAKSTFKLEAQGWHKLERKQNLPEKCTLAFFERDVALRLSFPLAEDDVLKYLKTYLRHHFFYISIIPLHGQRALWKKHQDESKLGNRTQ